MGGNISYKSGTNELIKSCQNTICYGGKLGFLRLFCAVSSSFFLLYDGKDTIKIKEILKKKLDKFEKMKAKSTHIKWVDSFKKLGCQFEHEAFLVCLLSREKKCLHNGRKYFWNLEQILGISIETEALKISRHASNEQHIKVEEEDNYLDVPPGFSPKIKEAASMNDLSGSFFNGQSLPESLTMYQNSMYDLQESLSKVSSCKNQITDLNYHPDSPLETQIIEVEIGEENIAKGRNTLLGLTPREAIAMWIISTFYNKEEKLGIPKEQDLKHMTTNSLRRNFKCSITSLLILYGSLVIFLQMVAPLVFTNAMTITYLQLCLLHSSRPYYYIGGCPKIFYNVP
ncbi:hypothetical protein M9H77_21646 [Catharanthus roseus]|uniref:Uncharacterized protein n=1 Tax=Catharanthus roseus TaxID=4058 RepID=A0ACC0AMX6_CATRO|nr:hypothetical protein M9H77_21646 [Catharanthus roseus]